MAWGVVMRLGVRMMVRMWMKGLYHHTEMYQASGCHVKEVKCELGSMNFEHIDWSYQQGHDTIVVHFQNAVAMYSINNIISFIVQEYQSCTPTLVVNL